MNKIAITPRNMYMDQVFRLLDSKNLLILLGIRRVGKSCIAMQLEEELQKRFPDKAHVIRISFEKNVHALFKADDLIAHLKGQYALDKKNYIFLDEILRVDDWERVVNFLYRLGNCKVILLSSNRRVISKKLKAIREENCDIIHILPLSFKEFIYYQRFRETTNAAVPLGEKQYKRFSDKAYTIHEIYKHYISYGGLPVLKPEYAESDLAWVVTDGSYGAIVTRDILEIDSGDGFVAVTNPVLLRSVISIMTKSLGSNISATWLGKQTSDHFGRPIATKTIQSYIQALLNAHMFYAAERYDIKAERVMPTMAKYYIVDPCFYYYLTDIHTNKESYLLENQVYFELLRRGCKVYNGKFGNERITFVAMKGDKRIYIQVANDMNGERLEQLFSPLRKIHDDHTKMVIAFGADSHTSYSVTYEGFIIMDALEFLMGEEFKL